MNAVEQLGQAITRFTRMELKQKAVSSDCKMSEVRTLFLLKLAEPEGMTVSELSRALRVTSPFVTQQLNSLEEGELITRKRDASDGRVVRIYLTDKGRHFAKEAENSWYKRVGGLVDYLGEDDSRQLAELLTRAYDYMEEQIYSREKAKH